MKLKLRPVISSIAVLAITGGVLAATVGTAAAAGRPAWEPDPNALGSLTFYNSAGTAITGGSNLSHLFDYAEASTTDAAGGVKATVFFANPTPSTPTGSWPATQESTPNFTPPAGAPGSLSTDTKPVAAPGPTEANLTSFIAGHTANTVAGYQNVYQIRVSTTGGTDGGSDSAGQYWEDDIQVQGCGWRVIDPTTGVYGTNTALTATPGPNAASGASVTLTATVCVPTAGSVQFKDGNTNIGSPVPVTVGSTTSVASTSTSSLSAGPHTLNAVFTPSDLVNYSGSTGTTTENIVPATSTALVITGNNTQAASGATLTATVTTGGSTPVNAGSVKFFDGSTPLPSNVSGGTSVAGTSGGTYTLTLSASGPDFTQGSHSVTAVFSPTDPTAFASSTSPAQQFFTAGGACGQTGSQCEESQNIQAEVPVGTLFISTPYSPTSPLDLGTLAINSTATQYSASAPFYCIVITDARSGQPLPWTANAESSDLTAPGGHSIDSQNVGLTNITTQTAPAPATEPGVIFPPGSPPEPVPSGCAGVTPVNSSVGGVTPTPNAAASPAVAPGAGLQPAGDQGLGGATPGSGGTTHVFAHDAGGGGTSTLQGTLTLNAPTTTAAGTYTGTIDFTIG